MDGKQLIDFERMTVAAFRDKRESDFVARFSEEYIGVANDGVKTVDGELKGLRALDLDSIEFKDGRATFPAENIGIVTYDMVVSGRQGRHVVNGCIHATTVYVRFGPEWKVVLHTESMAQPT